MKQSGKEPTRNNLLQLPNFAVLGSDIAKTGLGSSAALVSSLTAVLLSWAFGWNTDELLKENVSLAHNVAQLAHCQAQGKIGSGFDVAAAFFGSHHYVRFDSAPLNRLMESYAAFKIDSSHYASLLTLMATTLNISWLPHLPVPVMLPPGLIMILGECGKDMNTPNSVKKVLEWAAREKTFADELFANLDANNQHIINLLSDLNEIHKATESDYSDAIQKCAKVVNGEWKHLPPSKAIGLLISLNEAFNKQRGYMKALGEHAGTPVEPEEITNILNETERVIPGVLATGAPGAGGYDAVYTILLDSSLVEKTEALWMHWEELPMTLLTTTEQPKGVTLKQSN